MVAATLDEQASRDWLQAGQSLFGCGESDPMTSMDSLFRWGSGHRVGYPDDKVLPIGCKFDGDHSAFA